MIIFQVGESVDMHCDAQEAEGTQKPTIQWQRVSINVRLLVGEFNMEDLAGSIQFFMEIDFPIFVLCVPILQKDGAPLQRARVRVVGGNITIDSLRRTDFGYYHCVASNEVATIVTSTQLVVEGTQPHAPYNVTATATEFSVSLSWLPGYSGGPDYKQDYTIWLAHVTR